MTAKPAKAPSPTSLRAAPNSTLTVRIPTLAAVADELGALEKEYALALAPLELKLPRMKALKALLQAACPAKPDKEWIVEGARFGVRLGAKANERSIDFKLLVKNIGAAVYAKFATCTLKELEENVDHDLVEAVVSLDQTGPRKLTTYEKGTV